MSTARRGDAGGTQPLPLAVEGLVVDFPGRGVRALAGVDLEVATGEHVALLGPSGSGKTTLLRALLAAVPPAAGTVRVGGIDPFGSGADRRRLRRATGVVRQGDDLVLGVSGRVNALMGTTARWGLRDWIALARGRAPTALAGRLDALARAHGIEGCLDARVEQLSGGQRQRIALVRALLPDPGLLLADEPTAGLDPRTAADAVAALRGAGVTLVVATHDLAVAAGFPRVVALRDGAVVHDGDPLDEPGVADVYGQALA